MKVDLSQFANPYSKKTKFGRLLWGMVWGVMAAFTPRWMLRGWRRMLVRIFGGEIGEGVRINGSARIWQPWNLSIGKGSWIDENVSLYSVDKIRIGSNVVVSEGAFICTASHNTASPSFSLKTAPIEIHDNAWICARAIILPGVIVGEGAVIAAGAVVVHNVPAWSVVGGNPAVVVRPRIVV